MGNWYVPTTKIISFFGRDDDLTYDQVALRSTPVRKTIPYKYQSLRRRPVITLLLYHWIFRIRQCKILILFNLNLLLSVRQ